MDSGGSGTGTQSAHPADGTQQAPPVDARFGDSTWAAPYLSGNPHPIADLTETPDADGPRVAERDETRTGEAILRAPFKVVAMPFRWLATGFGVGTGLVLYPYVTNAPIYPFFDYGTTAGFEGGLGLRTPKSDSTGWTGSLGASISTKDHRRVMLEQRIGKKKAPILRLITGYQYAPNLPFYGIGNDTDNDRVIYLAEEGLAEALVPIGSDPLRQVRLIAGYSNLSVRHGYDGAPSIEEEFHPAFVPFLLEKSEVLSYGVGGDLALLNNPVFPSRGVHGRAELRRNHGLGDTEIEYMQWHLEARGYVPVFADRRVIALRVVHQGVDPFSGTRPVPYYRLPSSNDAGRFAAYSSDRFRDQKLLLGHLEYRWEIWDYAWAYLFTEWGAVAPTLDQFRFADGHESNGFGFRMGMTRFGAFSLELARGSDGVRIRFKGGDF
jgi:hypothetical protein